MFMLYTVDRVQFDENGQLIFFEFYDKEKDKKNFNFIKTKYETLSKISNVNLIGIGYGKNYYNNEEVTVVIKESRTNYHIEDYKEWFNGVNKLTGINSNSKELGSATYNEGDPFVNDLLKQLHSYKFSGYDDNGIALTKVALQNTSTFGFDFDLFDDINHTIIEFLKNETTVKGKNPLNNLKAHPMRYAWISEKEQKEFKNKMYKEKPTWKNPRKIDNRQKYISLWKATHSLGGELYLVNYCENYTTNELSIIHVSEIDEETGFMSDVSYKVSYLELIEWLQKMNKMPEEAKVYLTQFPKEVRNNAFWENYYHDANPIPNRWKLGSTYV